MATKREAQKGSRRPVDELMGQEPEVIAQRAEGVGEERLDRSAADILITGVIGGVEVSLGGMAAMLVLGSSMAAAPSLHLYGGLALAGLVFPIGFLFVILGRSELFTENFLIPVVSVVNRQRSIGSLAELWSLSWVGNLLASAFMALLLSIPHAIGDPIRDGYTAYTAHKLDVPVLGMFVSAILAGLVMTVLTWLVLAIRHPVGKIVAIWAGGYVLFASNLSHVIVSATVVMVGLGPSGHSVRDAAIFLLVATAGNLVGGVGFVTLFRLAQVWEKQRRG
ncbi:MAG: formate/nitrite transporter family protein [Candidatus Dormibacteria bacterium]